MKNLKNISKRTLALFLTLVMCLSMVNLTVFAAEDGDAEPTGKAVEEVYTCGEEEHQHTEACYEEQLVLKLDCKDEGHDHADEDTEITVPVEGFDPDNYPCYQLVLVCKEQETEDDQTDNSEVTDGETEDPAETPTEDPAETPSEDPAETPSEAPVETPSEDPAETPSEAPVETPSEDPVETPSEDPVETPSEAPVETPSEAPVETPSEAPAETPSEAPVETPSEAPVETPSVDPAPEAGEESVVAFSAETHYFSANDVSDDEDADPVEGPQREETESEGHTHSIDAGCYLTREVLACEFKDAAEEDLHVHTLDCVGAFAELVEGLEKFGPKLEAFQEEYFANLGEDAFDENGDLTEEAMAAFTEAAAAELGEEFNALIDLYKSIPERFAEESAYVETVATLENLAGLLGADLDNGVQVLAGTSTTVSNGDLSAVQKAIDDGNDVTVTEKSITIKNGGTLDLKGKTVTGSGIGSVFVVTGGTFTLKDSASGGTITGGRGSRFETGGQPGDRWYETYTAGGGVLVEGGTFQMEGGTISGNTANKGGGIFVAEKEKYGSHYNRAGGTLIMTGGSVTGNYAEQTPSGAVGTGAAGGTGSNRAGEGGGIWIGSKNNTISGGSITNNTSKTLSDWGGGGIYVNNSGDLTIESAKIASNTAYGLGGGVAGCPHAHMALSVSNGAVIYGNTAYKDGLGNIGGRPDNAGLYQNTLRDGTKVIGIVGDYLAYNDSEFTADKARDFYCVDACAVQGQLNTGLSWVGRYAKAGFELTGKDDNGNELAKPINQTNGDASIEGNSWYTVGAGSLGLKAVGLSDDNVSGKAVVITGNTSYTHGGGIGCNGQLFLGDNTGSTETKNTWSIEAKKELKNTIGTNAAMSADQFKFELWDNTTKVAEATNEADGTIRFVVNDERYAGAEGEGKSYNFQVKEVNTGDSSITYADDKTVTVVVAKQTNTAIVGKVTYTNTNSYVKSVTWHDGNTFTNTLKDGKLTINKTVVSPTPLQEDEVFKFQVKLTDKDGKNVTGTFGGYTFGANGTTVEIYGGSFKNNGNDKVASVTIDGIPAGVKYEVTEIDVDNALWEDPQYTEGKTGTIPANGEATAKITDTRSLVSLEVDKKVTWNDAQSQAPEDLTTQAFTVVVTLGNGKGEQVTGTAGDYAYNENGVYTFTLNPGKENDKAGDAAKITGIPTNTQYKVKEQGLNPEQTTAGYSIKVGEKSGTLTSEDTVTIENRYFKTKLTDLTVTKQWPEDEDTQKFLPKSVFVTLNGGPDDLEVDRNPSLSAETEWSYKWENLPMYRAENEPYTYSVKETGISYDGLEGTTYSADTMEGNLIRVRNTDKKTVSSTEENPVYEIVGGWVVSNSEPIETTGTAGQPKSSYEATIENKWLGKEDAVMASITIKKMDADLKDVVIPDVEFELEDPDGNKDTDRTGKDGTITFTGLKAGTYTLTETDPHEGYLNSNKGRRWEITIGIGNNLQKVEEQNKDGVAGEPVGKNTWSWTDAKGTIMPNKDGVISWNPDKNCLGGTLTITNEVIKGDLSIKKVLDLKDVQNATAGDKNAKFTFKVTAEDVFGLAKGSEIKTFELGHDKTETVKNLRYGTYKITEVTKELANYERTPVKFKGGEEAEDGSITVKVEENGKTYEVEATNIYTRDTGSLTIAKEVKGLSDENLYKDKKFTFTVKGPADVDGTYGSGVTFVNGEATVTITGANSITINGLPTGQYTVEEDEAAARVSGYNLSVSVISPVNVTEDGSVTSTVTNTYSEIPQSNNTSLTVKKVWKGDEGIDRPASVTVQLLRDGAPATGREPVTLSASNGWSYTWSGLSREFSWSVDEVNVPDGYTASVSAAGTTFTITNSYTDTDIPDEETPKTDIPEDPTPTTDLPDEEPPLVDLPDEVPPLTDLPEDPIPLVPAEPEVELPDDPIPLVPAEPEVELPEDPVPLANVPQTGDYSPVWVAALLLSAMGLAVLTLKKREDEEK